MAITINGSPPTEPQSAEFRSVFGLISPGYVLSRGSTSLKIQQALDYISQLDGASCMDGWSV